MTIKTKAKKIYACLLMFVMLALTLSSALAEPENTEGTGTSVQAILDGGPDIPSVSAVVMDINSGAILYAKNPTQKQQPSSLTKLMTAYVCLNELGLCNSISCSAGAASQDFPTAANVGYISGETFSVSDALKGMLLASAEDCAYSLAEKAAGSMDSFAVMMNEYGGKLGFVNSHFVNSMGLSANGHYSCAYDMAVVASKLMKNFPAYKGILSSGKAYLSSTNLSSSREIESSHRFMNGDDSCEYCYAAKTGGSAYGGDDTWAMCCYAAHNNMDLVCIIMGSPDIDDTYADTKTLFEYAFNIYEGRALKAGSTSSGNGIGLLFSEHPMFDFDNSSTIYADPKAGIIMPSRGDESLVTTSVSFEQVPDFEHGENIIGKINIFYDGRSAGAADIIYYTENAAMSEAAFEKVFPAYLNQPANTYSSYIKPQVKPAPDKASILVRAKNKIFSLYTPAKLAMLVFILLLFACGAAVIIIVFPKHGGSKITGLYTRRYEKKESDDVDSMTYDVRRVIKGDGDMTEIGSDEPEEIK